PVARHDELLAGVQAPHDLAAVVPQLPLGQLLRHDVTVARHATVSARGVVGCGAGPDASGRRRSIGQSGLRKTMPVRGLGWKKVVLGGMRSPPWAMAVICATVAGRRRTPASARPDVTASTTWPTPCW